LERSKFGVLLVDDVEPFRRVISSILKEKQDVQIIGEASDGFEAVRKAQELQPDLILLDIGLPKLNGIEAARQIRRLSPNSKILFLSQESSADIVRGALSTGARGYVVKTDAGSELLKGVDAVLRDEQFVSSRFAGHDFKDVSDSQISDGLGHNKAVAPPTPSLPQKAKSTSRHEALFYSDDACFLDGLTQFIGAALKARNSVIVLATESHRDSLVPRLQAHGLDIGAAIEQGRYIPLDAADTLSTFMVNGLPDPVRFLKVAGDLALTAAKAAKGKRPRVAACGECAPLLWVRGNAEAAIRLEQLWDKAGKKYDLDILCGYSLATFQGGIGSHVFEQICAEHSAIHSL
jgi:DNA-binding NarL/FixJ family response regulator